ncbi:MULTISPECIES: hypothetical protein [unclassified Streptomyces]|uniref:hypothetical protein n=1 Tax=unclassified Streptomyces TaxID=2593676 RepID=UPI00278BEC74|nr:MULTISPECIES: hypothetical protein [unclassified Streptomyces]
MTRRTRIAASAVTGAAATLLLGLAAPHASATPTTPTPVSEHARVAAHDAAVADGTLDTLSRFFARDGALTKSAAAPRIEGERAVPVYYLSRDFVAGKKGADIAEPEFLASKAVASDGRKASLWTVEQNGSWKVVNIASGDDETRYADLGHRELPGGTVFHEPQINAWYVADHARVLPLDADAVRAVGRAGTSVSAYRARVARAYGDKLPGSAYAKKGEAGGYGPAAATAPGKPGPEPTATVAGAGVLAAALGLTGVAVRRARSRRVN